MGERGGVGKRGRGGGCLTEGWSGMGWEDGDCLMGGGEGVRK